MRTVILSLVACVSIYAGYKDLSGNINIAGDYFKVGSGSFDWVYCAHDTNNCYNLIGMTDDGYLKWDTDNKPDRPSEAEFSGYYINYGDEDESPFDWIYISKDLKSAYKLNGANESGYFDWEEVKYDFSMTPGSNSIKFINKYTNGGGDEEDLPPVADEPGFPEFNFD